MKVAITTLYDYFNHGNRLQNYALEQTLKKLGCEVETYALASKKYLPFCFRLACAFPIMPVTRRLARSRKFGKTDLNSKNITSISLKKLCKNDLDFAIIGSDQVFNPAYIVDLDKTFLKFVSPEKRIAYSASFGISSLPKKLEQPFKEGLNEIKHISIRENAGAKIVEDLTGRKVPVVADPTFLLERHEWEEFAESAYLKNAPKEKYILTYFLLQKKEYKQKVKEISKEFGLKVININSFFDKYCSATPKEFMQLLKNAELVCTNSFHGHALSILMEKPFISFPSVKGTGSRIKTLLNITGLEGRNCQTLKKEDYFNLDYTMTRQKVKAERQKGLEFLKTALLLKD